MVALDVSCCYSTALCKAEHLLQRQALVRVQNLTLTTLPCFSEYCTDAENLHQTVSYGGGGCR